MTGRVTEGCGRGRGRQLEGLTGQRPEHGCRGGVWEETRGAWGSSGQRPRGAARKLQGAQAARCTPAARALRFHQAGGKGTLPASLYQLPVSNWQCFHLLQRARAMTWRLLCYDSVFLEESPPVTEEPEEEPVRPPQGRRVSEQSSSDGLPPARAHPPFCRRHLPRVTAVKSRSAGGVGPAVSAVTPGRCGRGGASTRRQSSWLTTFRRASQRPAYVGLCARAHVC